MAKRKKQPQESPAAKPTAKVGKRYFSKRLMVPGFGFVDAGEELTPEIQKAWNGWTKVPIENYTKE